MDVCKTDVRRIILYLDDAAKLYNTQTGLRSSCRAQMLRRLSKKLNNRLSKNEENDKATTH